MREFAPVELALYRHSLRQPIRGAQDAADALRLPRTQVDAALARLQDLALIVSAPTNREQLIGVAPEVAAVNALHADEAELERRRGALLARRSAYSSLGDEYDRAMRERAAVVVDVLDTNAEGVRRQLRERADSATEEVLVSHSGGGLSEDALSASLAVDIPLLERGVGLRILLQHTTRHHSGTRLYAREVQAAGAEIRTAPAVPSRFIVFDHQAAFVPRQDPGGGAVVLKEPDVIVFVRSVFDHLWATARPFGERSEVADSGSADLRRELRDEIAAMLVDGAKDEVIARRLGMSVRTCRRHIADLMNELGASSRFQAGNLIARRASDSS